MLYDFEGKLVDHIPHLENYKKWRANLPETDYWKVINAIHKFTAGKESFASRQVLGKEWQSTPYLPIYIACGKKEQEAAFFFGLLVWDALMQDSEAWNFVRTESGKRIIRVGLRYERRKQ